MLSAVTSQAERAKALGKIVEGGYVSQGETSRAYAERIGIDHMIVRGVVEGQVVFDMEHGREISAFDRATLRKVVSGLRGPRVHNGDVDKLLGLIRELTPQGDVKTFQARGDRTIRLSTCLTPEERKTLYPRWVQLPQSTRRFASAH